MEGSMENQISSTSTTSCSSPLSMHKNSQTISKTKPKIRIIHIFAPEIIKTDAANFRELVQRLTGKPSDEEERDVSMKKLTSRRKKEARVFSAKKKMEIAMRAGFNAAGFRERIKGEEEIWSSANSGAGFLGGFAEIDGFMQDHHHLHDDYFPLLEGTTQIMDVYGGGDMTTQIA